MKEIIGTTMLFSLLVWSGTVSAAKKPSIDKSIERSICFPSQLATPFENEIVVVAFIINNNCMIEIQQINASNSTLSDYVVEQLSKIDLRTVQHETGKTYCYKFSFHAEK